MIGILKKILYSSKSPLPAQRITIFKARCTISGKVCQFIIDSGNSENVVTLAFVKALQLQTTPHPQPYKIGCIKKSN